MCDFYNGGRHDVIKVSDFYNGGLWGKFSLFVGSNWNFVPGYIKKTSDTHHVSFSSKKQAKKIIAKKPLTNLYKINSTCNTSVDCTVPYVEIL